MYFITKNFLCLPSCLCTAMNALLLFPNYLAVNDELKTFCHSRIHFSYCMRSNFTGTPWTCPSVHRNPDSEVRVQRFSISVQILPRNAEFNQQDFLSVKTGNVLLSSRGCLFSPSILFYYFTVFIYHSVFFFIT